MSVTSSPAVRPRHTAAALSVVAFWLFATMAATAEGLFRADGPPLLLGAAIALPPLLVLGLLARSAGFRAWAASLDPRLLVNLQMWRIIGFAFLAVWGAGALPGTFALPAGVGDVLVAVAAPAVAWYLGRPGGRPVFLAWTALGIADLLVAVALGVLHASGFGPLAAGGVSTTELGELPLAVIPTFVVPLLLSVHLVTLVAARTVTLAGQSRHPGVH